MLQFCKPAGTSRGTLYEKPAYYIWIPSEALPNGAIGECGLLPGLSADDRQGYEAVLDQVVGAFNEGKPFPPLDTWPSIALGLDMAMRNQLMAREGRYFDNGFSRGEQGLQINGLVWMGDAVDMQRQIDDKIAQGFKCIKLKIGAIDFEQELKLLAYIRERYSREQMEIRVDANGAFSPQEAARILEQLAPYNLHSIEQPIKAGQWEAMANLCRNTPVPIALDEELIGLFSVEQRRSLMETVRPQAVVLKPSFLGSFTVSDEWIALANEFGAQWWITSALESNVGLNAIAQYTASKIPFLPQGLGTGGLYTNNVEAPLEIRSGHLWCNSRLFWNFEAIK